jgi:hypothetical protein
MRGIERRSEMQNRRLSGDFGLHSGGEDGSRTRLDGFAGRCITALLPRQRKMVRLLNWRVMCHLNRRKMSSLNSWSGRRVSNSRPQPWQGCALPTELLPLRSPANHTLFGAGEESRTLDLNLGKVALYQLSYSRTECVSLPTLLLLRSGAGEESRTLDLNLGKVALYQLSYSRILETSIIAEIVTTSKTTLYC